MSRFIQFTLAIAKGIASDQTARRRAMFAMTLAALAMLFVGAVPLWAVFIAHPLFFAFYWLACGWVTVCVILLAIYDLLIVIRAGREAKRQARRETFGDDDTHV